jgi:hypothetical protein
MTRRRLSGSLNQTALPLLPRDEFGSTLRMSLGRRVLAGAADVPDLTHLNGKAARHFTTLPGAICGMFDET